MQLGRMWSLAAAGICAAGLAGAANAQDADTLRGPNAGEYEATLSGTGNSNNDFDSHTLGVSGSVGKYVTDNWLLGVRQGVNFADPDGGDNIINGRTLGFAQYVFDFGNYRPFIGLNAGGIYGDQVSDTFAAGPEVGLKYYPDNNTFIFGMAEYQFVFDSLSDADDTFKDGNFAYTVGIGFNF